MSGSAIPAIMMMGQKASTNSTMNNVTLELGNHTTQAIVDVEASLRNIFLYSTGTSIVIIVAFLIGMLFTIYLYNKTNGKK